MDARIQILPELRLRLISEGDITKESETLSCFNAEADSPVVSTLNHVRPKFVGVVDRFVARLLDELSLL